MDVIERVTDSATRVLAPNPSPMTLDGTNTWVLQGGAGGSVVVDPGPPDEAHLERILDLGPVALILLTHHHIDHSESVERLRELTGASVAAADPALCFDAPPLVDSERRGHAGVEWITLLTPGHSRDSACLLLVDDRALLTGDTVLGRGTTVVAHPDGRLADYLESLRRLRDVAAEHVDTLLPGHGPVGRNPLEMLDFYLAHRQERLTQVSRARDALGAHAAPMDVVRVVYADVDRSLWPAAELSVRAQLEYLDDAGGTPSAHR